MNKEKDNSVLRYAVSPINNETIGNTIAVFINFSKYLWSTNGESILFLKRCRLTKDCAMELANETPLKKIKDAGLSK